MITKWVVPEAETRSIDDTISVFASTWSCRITAKPEKGFLCHYWWFPQRSEQIVATVKCAQARGRQRGRRSSVGFLYSYVDNSIASMVKGGRRHEDANRRMKVMSEQKINLQKRCIRNRWGLFKILELYLKLPSALAESQWKFTAFC